jgi:large repetitive protein
MGLAPFVEAQPDHGNVGRVIKILGTNLGGASSVTFNGAPAVFKVISNSLIGATVPVGATTGTIQVTTLSGVLSTDVPFTVMP